MSFIEFTAVEYAAINCDQPAAVIRAVKEFIDHHAFPGSSAPSS